MRSNITFAAGLRGNAATQTMYRGTFSFGPRESLNLIFFWTAKTF